MRGRGVDEKKDPPVEAGLAEKNGVPDKSAFKWNFRLHVDRDGGAF